MKLLDFIGNTPLVEVNKLNPNPNVQIYAKLEGHNPGGSVKDRAAYRMIKGAVERGEIKKGQKLITKPLTQHLLLTIESKTRQRFWFQNFL